MLKNRLPFVLLTVGLLLSLALGCSSGQKPAGATPEMTKTPRPTFTDVPPATATAAPTPAPTLVTQAATATLTPAAASPTPVPKPTETRKPTSYPAAPTNTPRPQPTNPPPPRPTNTPAPQVGAHGVIGRLRLRESRTQYGVNEQVFFVFEVENKSGKDIPFGILGLKADNNVPFKTSWTSDVYNHQFKTTEVFRNDDHIVFTAPGTYTVKLAICFSPYSACQGGGADWEEFAPGVTVTIR